MKRYVFTWEDGSNEVIEASTKAEAKKRFTLIKAESGIKLPKPISITEVPNVQSRI